MTFSSCAVAIFKENTEVLFYCVFQSEFLAKKDWSWFSVRSDMVCSPDLGISMSQSLQPAYRNTSGWYYFLVVALKNGQMLQSYAH